MTDAVIARRYAHALFALGGNAGAQALEAHGRCLLDLTGMMREQPKLAQTLKSPAIGIADKKAVLATLLGRLGADATMKNFCFLLADKKRLGSLGRITECYGQMLDEANGVKRGRVTTAIQLTPAKQAALRDALQRKAGGKMELTFAIDPEILGGMVLAVGDKVLDSSLRAQLGNLRKSLIRGCKCR